MFDYDTPEDIATWNEAARYNADARHRAEMVELRYPDVDAGWRGLRMSQAVATIGEA